MPLFTYIARDRSGQTVRGLIAAENLRQAAGQVRDTGLERTRVRLSGPRTRLLYVCRRLVDEFVRPAISSVPLPDMVVFWRQLATLVGAGISAGQALAGLEPKIPHPRLRAAVAEAQAHVMRGGRLSEVMAAHRDVFSEMQVEMLRAAEHGGMLARMMSLLAGYLEQELETRRLISRLTIYPKLVALSALFIVGKSFLLAMGGGMPAISALVIGGDLWAYLNETLFFLLELLLVAFGVTAFFRLVLFRSEAARERYEQIKWALPGLGVCVRKFAFAKFGRAFGALYGAGLSLGTAIEVAGNASGSRIIARATRQAVVACDRGVLLSEGFSATGTFPPLVIAMLQTGEQTGNVDTMMNKAAEYLEDEAAARAHLNSYLFATGMYLLVALIIGASVIGFWGGFYAR